MKTPIPFILVLASVSLAVIGPDVQAVVPPPDGGYPNFNTAEGQNALKNLTTGAGNTAVGWSSLFSVTTGNLNTALGAGALALNTADQNTATGADALLLNTTGTANTANGAFALFSNGTGNSNTGLGNQALFANTQGSFNTATGSLALGSNTAGSNNTAVGAGALESNAGEENTALGSSALLFNTSGNSNTASGFQALFSNTDADGNTAYGYQALSTSTGSFNTAVGFRALVNKTTGTDNIALGSTAGDQITTGNNNIDIGNDGAFSDSGVIRIGYLQTATFIAGIHGVNEGGSGILPVYINNLDQLGTQPPASSRRYKHNIKPMETASDAILALKPVAFQYKDDKTNTPQFGLVAEEVAAVNPDLVVRDEEGKPYSVRYDQVNAMLLNEFLKAHRKVETQQKQIDDLTNLLKRQDARIQKISDQLEMIRPAGQVAQTGR